MKKVLIVSFNPIYPLYSGGALAQYYFIDELKDKVQFILCTEVKTEKELENIRLLQEIQPNLKIHYTCTNPNKVRKSFIYRLKTLIKKMLQLKKTNQSSPSEADDFTDNYFEHVDHVYSREFADMLLEVIQKEKISQVQFDFYETIDLCWLFPDSIRKIFIHHEVRYKRLTLAAAKSKVSENYKKFLIDKTEAFERMCLRKMDHVVVFNEDDFSIIKEDCKNITLSPYAIPKELIIKEEISPEFIKFIFLGGEGHTPNKLGLFWFIESVYFSGTVSQQFPLYIIGDWSEEVKNKYQMHPEIFFCGLVEDLRPYYENAILINPVLTGAGIRTKVLQAFVNHVPVISTRFGAEGCFTDINPNHIVLFDDAEEFNAALKTIDFKDLTKKAYQYYQSAFVQSNLAKIRYDIYS
ncbi:MAG: glycosyltransferase family 4 protein [Paludibacter sp.]|nr:glycosyltransferase family 4 protein [Paludibacter sp.]